jgi:type VI secretion system secreted protein VgrG
MATRDFNAAFKAGSLEAYKVLAFREEHRLGRPAEATITCQLAEYVDPEELIGQGGSLVFSTGYDEASVHYFGGTVESVTVIGSTSVGEGSVHHVRFHVVSQMALLARSEGCEIHQELDVKEIVTKVLTANGIDGSKQEWKLTGSYPKREYCVQYNESVLAFVSRLLEEEGIYFRSEMREDGEFVIFEDDSSTAPPIEGDDELHFRQRTGLEHEQDAIYKISERGRVCSGKFTLRDYDFKRPKLDMTAEAEADADTDLEIYDFPGHYFEPSEGKRLAKVRLEAEQATRSTLVIEADCVRLECGKKIKISEALHDEINGAYVLTAVWHEFGHRGIQPTYNVGAALIPEDVKFRSPRVTPWPVIEGPQTASVVAPAGSPAQEIHTDEHGRSKVKFHWDLSDITDDKASCWMRTEQLQTSGSMVLPRIGWEVIVEFLEGNPDRPIVTGRLYDGLFMPPYALPEGKTRTSLQTASTPGGGGSNEIRFEDKAGSEEIMIHAQYDQTITTANNKTTTVGNNETKSVKVDSSTTIGANQDIKVTKGVKSDIGGNQSSSVGGNRSVEVNAVTGLNVGGSSTTSVGGNHFEMDGNPLQALLALAAQKVAEVAKAAADNVIGQVQAAVQSKVDQVLAPVNRVQGQMQQIGQGMQAVANGDLGAAAPLMAQAAGLPTPPAFASSLAGGGGGGGGGEGGGGGGGGSNPFLDAADALAQPGNMANQAVQAGADAATGAAHSAIDSGVNAAANALGAALGLDSDGGGGESAANVGGPDGAVDGVDAEDRAKGPGHSINKVGGNQTEKVGSVRIIAALNGVATQVSGNTDATIGAARAELAWGNRAEDVGGNKDETALGLIVVSRADETEKVTGSKTAMIGGAILEKIAGGHSISAGAPATFIGAFHKIEAATAITLTCGASTVVIDGSGIAITSPLVTIMAGKVTLAKAVSEV